MHNDLSATRRRALLGATCLMFGACIGPQGSHRPGYEGPTGPSRQATTNLRGLVIDRGTGAAIAGALVEADGSRSVSAVDGSYNLPGLTLLAVNLVTSSAGYDTARTLLPLDGGDRLWVIRMRSTPTVPIAP